MMSAAKRPLSKKDLDDIKKKDDLQRSAEVFSEFIQTFEDAEPSKKFTTFVRGGVVLPGKGEESIVGDEADKLYALKPRASQLFSSQKEKASSSRPSRHSPPPSSSSSKPVLVKKEKDKKKSQLETFKEELKQIQHERDERKRLKHEIHKIETKIGGGLPASSAVFLEDDNRVFDGTYDLSGDSSSTNLYMGNLAPNITEEQIAEIFGKFGPIASVKIMYPRGEDKEEIRAGRNTLCGFVAFMCRVDAERAMYGLRGKEVVGIEMRLGWGKAVPIPAFPIYVPPKLADLLESPPESGLPFNAQPAKEDIHRLPRDGFTHLSPAETTDILSRATVRVTQPPERGMLLVIHRVIEFVVREGPIFEAMLMQREKGNPVYRFLFDNYSNEHAYYRWKLFSVLQGETATQWRSKEFRMFEGGPVWKPPPVNPYVVGMPEELIERRDDSRYVKEPGSRGGRRELVADDKEHPVSSGKAGLSVENKEQLEKILSELTAERNSVADAMVFCIDHRDTSEDVVNAVCSSLTNETDSPMKKIAKVYLISDILHNSGQQNAWYFRNGFEQKFPLVFMQIRKSHRSIVGRLKAEQYKQRMMSCFRAWEDWALYPPKLLVKFQNIFLGLEAVDEPEEELDGKPLADIFPTTSLLAVLNPHTAVVDDSDVDGIPLDDELDGEPLDLDGDVLKSVTDVKSAQLATAPVGFAASRWETIDPEQVKAQAITTSKWDQVEEVTTGESSRKNGGKETAKDKQKESTTKSIDDEVRERLREIEVRVLKYQDDLETGRRSRNKNESVDAQVEKYRQQLIKSTSSGNQSSATSTSSSRDRDRNERNDKLDREKDRPRRSRSRDSERDRDRNVNSVKRGTKRSRSPRSPSSERTRTTTSNSRPAERASDRSSDKKPSSASSSSSNSNNRSRERRN